MDDKEFSHDLTKILLIGFGEMGQSHFSTINNSLKAKVIGIVRLKNYKSEFNIPTFFSVSEALDHVKPNLCVISTPHYLHFEQAKQCLIRGIHVLVEKPMALHFSEAEELTRLAEENNKLLLVGLQRRYEGFANIFRELRKNGKLGNIRLIHGLFAHRFESSSIRGWRADKTKAGAGIIDDSALHLIDLLLFFAEGKVIDLKAKVICNEESDLPNSFTCIFDTENGITISASGSYLSPVNSVQEEISIWGTNGSLFARRFCKEWNQNPPQIFFKSKDGKIMKDYDVSNHPSGVNLPLKLMLKVLAGEEQKEILLSQAKYTLETHRVIELIRNQM